MANNEDEDQRPKTEARKRMAAQVREAYEQDPTLRQAVLEARLERPKRRADCAGGPRPCPWVSCRYHLAYEITRAGGLKSVFPGQELDSLPGGGCALDLANRGGMTLEQVAEALHMVRERARQVEEQILAKLRARLETGR